MDDDADLGVFFTRDSRYWTLINHNILKQMIDITVVDASSDMLVIDITSSKKEL
jgi:hypothetical protein